MGFDISRVYSAVNADKLKVGSKILVADTLAELRQAKIVHELKCILGESAFERFVVEADAEYTDVPRYALAYLVSEPAKLKWTDLKIGDIIKNEADTAMVTAINSDADYFHIYAGSKWIRDNELKDWEKVENDI